MSGGCIRLGTLVSNELSKLKQWWARFLELDSSGRKNLILASDDATQRCHMSEPACMVNVSLTGSQDRAVNLDDIIRSYFPHDIVRVTWCGCYISVYMYFGSRSQQGLFNIATYKVFSLPKCTIRAQNGPFQSGTVWT